MQFEDFATAATTSDLSMESEVRVVDVKQPHDAIYEIEHGADDVKITKALQNKF